ncbi:jg27980, partial [Pararge aegeria aegeria]
MEWRAFYNEYKCKLVKKINDTDIDTLAGKLSSAAYAVKKIRQITDVETARLVY